ncbi:hypothetical protein Tco_0875137 [Tanacetum coccineum]|uniref:DUF4283 domain-containing protein n=1 Tax=Tanacetum coccineum TaxID=301880 RepID=A0ABQ5BNL8_9ASTR
MAQPQRLDDVHQDELFSPNKRYELMDANKKIDLDNLLYSNESKIMANIIQNHPLRFNIAASSYVSWIYLGHFSHTFQEDGSKYRLKFALGRKEILLLMISEESFICLKLPITIMNDLSPSNFKTTGLVQPWQILGKIAQCLTTRVTGHDQPPLQIMQIARDKYQNLEDNVMVKNIYNQGNLRNATVFGVDVPTTQSQLIESTQGTHRTTSAPRLEPRSDKESSEVEITADVQPVNINEKEEESAEDDNVLKRREKGKHVEESRSTLSPTIIRSPRTHSTLISSDTKKL